MMELAFMSPAERARWADDMRRGEDIRKRVRVLVNQRGLSLPMADRLLMAGSISIVAEVETLAPAQIAELNALA